MAGRTLSTMFQSLVLMMMLVGGARGVAYFRQLGYLRLPTSLHPIEMYRILGDTAEQTAYDSSNNILYVIGTNSKLLHVIDVSNPSALKRLTSYEFQPGDGVPRDVEICKGRLAVSLGADLEVYEGHVQVFDSYNRDTNSVQYRYRVTAGIQPNNIEFTPDCNTLIVANEGSPSMDNVQRYIDPEGSISLIIFDSAGNPIEKFVDFNNFNLRQDIRIPGHSIPTSVLPITTTVSQELEPEYITCIDNSYAYVTFQENDAIGRVNIKTAQLDILTPLPVKQWAEIGIDASDRDGGVHLRQYPLLSHRLPDTIKAFKQGRRTLLFVADEGVINRYTDERHGFSFNHASRGHDLLSAGKFDAVGINNATLIAQLNQDSRLGRLHISEIDGISQFSGKIDRVHTFGGRGFSIYDATSMKLLFDSRDHLETVIQGKYYDVFNTDVDDVGNNSPESLKDTTSDDMGPAINALDVASDNGVNYLVVGTKNSGILVLYTFNVTGTGVDVFYENIYRRGSPSELYSEAYINSQMGDAHISDLRIIKASESPNNRTLVAVTGNASGSVSFYQIDTNGSANTPLQG